MTRNKLLPVWKRYSTHQVIQVKTRQLSPCPSQEQVGFLKPEKQRNPIENEQEKNKASLAHTEWYIPSDHELIVGEGTVSVSHWQILQLFSNTGNNIIKRKERKEKGFSVFSFSKVDREIDLIKTNSYLLINVAIVDRDTELIVLHFCSNNIFSYLN